MKIFNNPSITNNYKGCALAIGNFDGVHKDEFLNSSIDNYDKILEKYKVKTNYYLERLIW